MDLIKRFFLGVVLWATACTALYLLALSEAFVPVIPAPRMLDKGVLGDSALFSFIGMLLIVFYDERRGRQKWEEDVDEPEA